MLDRIKTKYRIPRVDAWRSDYVHGLGYNFYKLHGWELSIFLGHRQIEISSR